MLQTDESERRTISYIRPGVNQIEYYTTVRIDKTFLPTVVYERRYGDSHWAITEYPVSPPALHSITRSIPQNTATQTLTKQGEWERTLVQVELTLPFSTASKSSDNTVRQTLGLVVDAEQGLVVINSNHLITPFADIRLIFPEANEVPATVFRQHPKYPMMLLKYNPDSVRSQVFSAELVDITLKTGMNVTLIGLNKYGKLKVSNNQLSSPFNPVQHLYAAYLTPIEEAKLENAPLRRDICDACYVTDSHPGMIANEEGEIIGWSVFSYGTNPTIIPGGQIIRFVTKALIQDAKHTDLGVGVRHLSVHTAMMDYGVPEEWIKKKPESKFSFLKVTEIDQTAPAAAAFNIGDVILAVNAVSVYEYSDLEEQVQENETVEVIFIRNGQINAIRVNTVKYPFEEFRKVITWQGMTLHTPLKSFNVITKLEHGCVFIADVNKGSPAQKAFAHHTHCIAEVGGKKTPDLETFLKVVKESQPSQKDTIKLKIVSVQTGEPVHIDIRPDYIYWPTREYLQNVEGHWHMHMQ